VRKLDFTCNSATWITGMEVVHATPFSDRLSGSSVVALSTSTMNAQACARTSDWPYALTLTESHSLDQHDR
jgi:hypothetical protein